MLGAGLRRGRFVLGASLLHVGRAIAISAAAGTILALARPARSQTSPDSAGAQPSAPSADPLTTARTHFDLGTTLYRRRNFEGALSEFTEAHRLLEGHPSQYTVLRNLAQCHQSLFRYDQAIALYRRFLTDAPADATAARAEVEGTLAALDNLLGTLVLTVNAPEAEVWVDDVRVGTAPGEIRVAVGRHVVQLRAAGHLPAQREVQVSAGARVPVEIRIEVIRQLARVPVSAFAGITALAGASLAAGGGCGLAAVLLSSSGRSSASAGDQLAGVPQQERIRTLSLAADGLFAGGAALGVASLTLGFFVDWRRRSPEVPPRAWLVPVVEPGSRTVGVGGTF